MDDFELQLKIWGYHLHKGAGDISTIVSESRPENDTYWTALPVWDKTEEYLKTVRLNGEVPPERFALWWLCEHERRHH